MAVQAKLVIRSELAEKALIARSSPLLVPVCIYAQAPTNALSSVNRRLPVSVSVVEVPAVACHITTSAAAEAPVR